MKSTKKMSEKELQNLILDWLHFRNILAFQVNNTGIFDPIRGFYRTPGRGFRKGISDIFGIYKGRPLAIECKSSTGKVTPEQILFLGDWGRAGGIAILARTLEDVENALLGVDKMLEAR